MAENSQENPFGAKSYGSAQQLMRSLWRRECGSARAGAASVGDRLIGGGGGFVATAARTLNGWAAFLSEGEMPANLRGPVDPYSVSDRVRANERCFLEYTAAKRGARALLDEQVVSSRYLDDDLGAAELMCGMKSSAAREAVTLFEGARSITDPSGAAGNGAYGCSPAGDETLLVLDRLQEVTERAQQLQMRLREEHLHRQRSVLLGASEVLTVGQAGLLRELKLANDNLRWRLQQRDRVLAANREVISRLQDSLVQSQRSLAETVAERDRAQQDLAAAASATTGKRGK